MPFPKSAQRKGGSRPATESQKAAARKWVRENKPWTKSTGPKSVLGKTVTSGNAIKAAYVCLIKNWQCDFAAEILKAESVIAELEQAFCNREIRVLDTYYQENRDGGRVVRRYVIRVE